MLRKPVIAALLTAAVLMLGGCSRGTDPNSMEVKGSDTMVNLGQAWAEEYRKQNPDANISVTGGGSGTGIAALINGNTDIAEASREMKPEELEQARGNGMDPKEFVVARDGVSVLVNRANPVGRLTIDQLSDIFTGRITNWRQVGGRDADMVVLSRDRSSGTHVFFLEHVLRKGDSKAMEEFAQSVLMLPSSQAIADEVAGNPAAIGYVGLGYADPARHKLVSIARDPASPYVQPKVANVLNDTYPIARPLYFYTPGEPEGLVKSFIDFVLSDEGQAIVRKQDFVPVR